VSAPHTAVTGMANRKIRTLMATSAILLNRLCHNIVIGIRLGESISHNSINNRINKNIPNLSVLSEFINLGSQTPDSDDRGILTK
ncbi:MAG: hypothetical protein V3V89_04035, partial [Gammaproteobacteria bacterium]